MKKIFYFNNYLYRGRSIFNYLYVLRVELNFVQNIRQLVMEELDLPILI